MKGLYTYKKKGQSVTNRRHTKPKASMAEEEFEPKFVETSHEDKRRLIMLFFLETIQAPPPEEWKGPGGTVSKMIEALKFYKSQRRRIDIFAFYKTDDTDEETE
jgi:hypothetical protein